MSQKNRDEKNRWRNVTIAFRVSPEENESINMRVRLSGLSKQEYITRRCQERDVVVIGNSRVHKALKSQLENVYFELQRIKKGSDVPDTLEEAIQMLAITLGGLQDKNVREDV
jgi:hypothetical protein